MVSEKIISEMCISLLGIPKEPVLEIVDSAKRSGSINGAQIRNLAQYGIPIVSIASSVLKVSSQDIISSYTITYQDLIIMLGIFAQDLKFRSQTNKY